MFFCRSMKGITPKICRLCVYVIINKRLKKKKSLLSFMRLDQLPHKAWAAFSYKKKSSVYNTTKSRLTIDRNASLTQSYLMYVGKTSRPKTKRTQYDPVRENLPRYDAIFANVCPTFPPTVINQQSKSTIKMRAGSPRFGPRTYKTLEWETKLEFENLIF